MCNISFSQESHRKIRRKPLFYIVNLIIPCVGIFYLSILVFYLPAQSGEKTALAIAILVSQTLYFTLVIEVIPATSLTLPLLGRYLLFSMVLVAVSVCLATIVLNLHYRKPSTHRMPTWVRNVLIQKMPGILMMRVPKQVIHKYRFFTSFLINILKFTLNLKIHIRRIKK